MGLVVGNGSTPRGDQRVPAFWYRTDSGATCSRAWARLDPLSANGAVKRHSHRRSAAAVSAAAAHPTGWLSGFPTGRPWDFASGPSHPGQGLGQTCGSCLPFPGPIPRIACLWRLVAEPLETRWARRIAYRRSLTSRSDPPRAATITPIAFGAFSRPHVGWPCRWPPAPPCPPSVASHGIALRGPDSIVRSVFHFRRSLPCPTTRGFIQNSPKIPQKKRDRAFTLSTVALKPLQFQGLPGA